MSVKLPCLVEFYALYSKIELKLFLELRNIKFLILILAS